MKEQLMKKALNYLNSAEAFASKEIPAYIEELLSFKFYEHLISTFLILLPLAAALVMYKVFLFYAVDKDEHRQTRTSKMYERDLFYVPFIIVSTVVLVSLIVLTCGSYGHTMDLIKIKVAPRVYLIDYFKKELK